MEIGRLSPARQAEQDRHFELIKQLEMVKSGFYGISRQLAEGGEARLVDVLSRTQVDDMGNIVLAPSPNNLDYLRSEQPRYVSDGELHDLVNAAGEVLARYETEQAQSLTR